jgi:hypothetical protein
MMAAMLVLSSSADQVSAHDSLAGGERTRGARHVGFYPRQLIGHASVHARRVGLKL